MNYKARKALFDNMQSNVPWTKEEEDNLIIACLKDGNRPNVVARQSGRTLKTIYQMLRLLQEKENDRKQTVNLGEKRTLSYELTGCEQEAIDFGIK